MYRNFTKLTESNFTKRNNQYLTTSCSKTLLLLIINTVMGVVHLAGSLVKIKCSQNINKDTKSLETALTLI